MNHHRANHGSINSTVLSVQKQTRKENKHGETKKSPCPARINNYGQLNKISKSPNPCSNPNRNQSPTDHGFILHQYKSLCPARALSKQAAITTILAWESKEIRKQSRERIGEDSKIKALDMPSQTPSWTRRAQHLNQSPCPFTITKNPCSLLHETPSIDHGYCCNKERNADRKEEKDAAKRK